MKFLRFLSLVLTTIMLSGPLLAEHTLTTQELTDIGLVNTARLRLGTGDDWGYLLHTMPGDFHAFYVLKNPTTWPGTIGASNLASIFNVSVNVNATGDTKVALWVTVFGSGYNLGRTAAKRYADNPRCTETQTSLFTVVSPTALPAKKPGVYQLGFKRADGSYLTRGEVDGSKDPQYYDVEILSAGRESNRGAQLLYENTCYRISLAGTPLFGWFYTDNIVENLGALLTGFKKTLLFGTSTYATGSTDTRQNSPASYMVILNSDQNKASAGPIKYGDFVRIIGLHTANAAGSSHNNYVEAYTWGPANTSGTSCVLGGLVYNFQTNYPVPNNNELLVIVNPNYAKGTPVCANDAIQLIPYYFAQITGEYPYTSKSSYNISVDTYPGNWAFSLPVVNPTAANTTRYNLFSLTAVAQDTSAPYLSAAQSSWNFSIENQYFILPVTKATTIATILTTVYAALTKSPMYDKATLSAACMTKLDTAIGLATTTQQCTYIKDELLGKLASLGVATSSLQAKLDARLAQITQGQAEKKEEQQNLAADEAARIAALKTKDITIMISALNDITTATPVSKANVSKAIATAFTTATSLVKTATDAAALATSFANAIKKGYVTAGTRSAFDTRYAQIKKESAAVTALTQKTTLVDLNNALASVVSYKAPITDGFATQILAGIEKAFGAAKAQWTQVQTLRKSKVARDANAARTTFASLVAECNKLAGSIKAVASMSLTTTQKNSRNKLSTELANFQKTLK